MPVYYIDGQSQGNEQNSLPRKAKIAIAYAESDTVDHGKFRIYWQPIGDRTNNEAEYYALLKALELIAEKATGKSLGNIGEALVRSDSKLVVNQVNGEWRVEDERVMELSSQAREMAEWFCMVVGVPFLYKKMELDPLEEEIRKLTKATASLLA